MKSRLPKIRHALPLRLMWGMAAALCAAACTTDPYESGDGMLSYVRADFVEAVTDNAKNVVSAQTDDGTKLWLSPALTAKWITVADTTYRALLYYNATDSLHSEATVKPVAISSVVVTKVTKGKATPLAEGFSTDPVALETAWMRGSRYINLGLQVKTGTSDGKTGTQSLGMLYKGTETRSTGRMHRLQLLHGQNGVPEYYSAQVYVSVPLYDLPFETSPGDSIRIAVNTYDGETTRTFAVR